MRFALLPALGAVLALSACQQRVDEAPSNAADEAIVTEAPAMPIDAPPQEEVDEALAATATLPSEPGVGSCVADIGEAASARLVERCVQLSPATRPPCNAANPCELIQGEIDRSCAMYGPDEERPAECAA